MKKVKGEWREFLERNPAKLLEEPALLKGSRTFAVSESGVFELFFNDIVAWKRDKRFKLKKPLFVSIDETDCFGIEYQKNQVVRFEERYAQFLTRRTQNLLRK